MSPPPADASAPEDDTHTSTDAHTDVSNDVRNHVVNDVANDLGNVVQGDTQVHAPAASLDQGNAGTWVLAGAWTATGLGRLADSPEAAGRDAAVSPPSVLDGTALVSMDSAGAWVLQRQLQRRGGGGAQSSTSGVPGARGAPGEPAPSAPPRLIGWPPRAEALMQALMQALGSDAGRTQVQAPRHGLLHRCGQQAVAGGQQALAFVAFVGEVGMALAAALRHPQRLRWRVVLREVEIGGFQALPIVGLTSFLLGVVVAYQGAEQLRNYGANVFVVELVGYAMLREFAPLITAIIIAGRSGSAYAAQIGTMVVTEEVDALRTLGISPQERLVLPKLLALALALPLLTVFADVTGVFGGMVMARSQLDIGFGEFTSRFGRVMQGTAFLIGVGKALVFAFIIVLIGCFQGFRTRGSADSVGRQTTLSVVQAIFLVIVVDAVFSVAFNLLDL